MSFLKKAALIAAVLTITLTSILVYARITHTLLVFDSHDATALPDQFRTTNDPLPEDTHLNKVGLDKVHAAGSQQFSSGEFAAALKKIPSNSVIVVDLRRESHGILNNDAISWFGPQNAANEKKTVQQIKLSEARLLERVAHSPYRWIYHIVEKTDDDYVDKAKREFVQVKRVLTEQQLVENKHARYQRFYIEDFHGPDEASVVKFVNFAKSIPDNTWLYFHCRAGRGRTTTFMSMYDMMKNAKLVTFDEIMDRQLALGGTDLRELPEGNFKYPYAAERLAFLKNFHQYAKMNNDNFSTSYTDWKRNHPGL